MATMTFDPGKFALNISGVLISGFEDGTFVEVARASAIAATKVSADGKEVGRVQLRNKSGTLTLTLLATADANAFLDGLRQMQEAGTLNHFPVGIDDSTNTEIFSANGWIQDIPSYSYGTEVGSRQWVLGLASIDYVVTPQTTAWTTIKNKISSIVTDIFG
jgi:hypothetical protein